jgi:short-subunit dehydrogenase
VLNLNARTPMLLAHHFGGRMRARSRGGIILVGSMAGYAGGADIAVYTGAKAFSRIFAESLWYELKPHGVAVLGLILGATRTPAMARAGMVMDDPNMPLADPEVVAREGLDHLADGPLRIAGGSYEGAHYMSTLPRAEAVALQSEAGRALFPKQN